MPNFKVGDIIIGRPEASIHYTQTCEGWRGKVFDVRNNGKEIYVYTVDKTSGMWWVEAKYFDLYDPAAKPAPKPTCKFKVGDKVICHSSGERFDVEELGRIVEVDPDDDRLDIRVEKLESGDDWWESSKNFELYKEPAPEYKTEHRPAKVGEYVKVLSEDGHHRKKGEVYRVVRLEHDNWVTVESGEKHGNVLRYEQYDVVLNYQPEPAADPEPTYKTEHRKAKEGEYVIIINTDGHNFAVGDICKASSRGGSLLNAECVKGSRVGLGQYLREDNYDVLIDYDPNAASAEPSTTPSTAAKPTSKREHDEHRKVRVRFKKSKYRTLEGEKEYRKKRAQIDNLDGCTVIVIGDSGVLFNLDYGVLKVDLRYCELF